MSEELNLPNTRPKAGDRRAQYQALLPQLASLTAHENDSTANLANITAALKEAFGFFWVGFYRVIGKELVLGPFQGPLACTRIPRGKGVCGVAWTEGSTQIVADVKQFPGHIACSTVSRSEIVVPFSKAGKTVLVLDIDSDQLNDFSDLDKEYLEQLQSIIERFM